MFDINTYNAIRNDLKLAYPVKLIFSEKVDKNADAYHQAVYNNKGKFTSHRITIYITNPSRSIEALIAHELIHAWQVEAELMETHGKYFKSWAKYITDEYQIFDVYIPRIDLR